ncbi:MAG: alanine--glyoxylate aminotransferase family protein [Candidatus Limnocylindrales bacterium]
MPTRLHVPGPTPLPDSVREAGGRQMINHRGAEFRALLGRITSGLQRAMRTEHDVCILTASGTGGLESGIVNHCSPGDPILAVSTGAFGDRFASIATRYGADVTRVETEWGSAAEPEVVRAALEAMLARGRPPAAILLTHNETSTGVTNPIETLARLARAAVPDILILVDGISGVGALPFETDAWDIDILVTGSQKAWMVPPGLAMVAVSPRAWSAAERATMPRFYLDLRAHRESSLKGETPWTPAVGLCFGLDVALAELEAEGWDAVHARHMACGAAARAGFRALGFDLLADAAHASNTVTAAWLPDGVEWSTLNRALKARGLVLAGGQGKLSGKILRMGHLGSVTVEDVLSAISIVEAVRIDLGLPVAEPGEALAVASRAAVDAGAPVRA